MGLIGMIVKRSQRYFKEQQEYLGYVNGQVEEVYGGHNIVKAFNKEDDVIDEFDRDNDRLYRSAWKSQFLSGMMMPIMQSVGNLGLCCSCNFGGYLAIKKTIEVGDIQSFHPICEKFYTADPAGGTGGKICSSPQQPLLRECLSSLEEPEEGGSTRKSSCIKESRRSCRI